MFDPWNSTLEEALDQDDIADKGAIRPSTQWVGAYVIGLRKKRVDAGDGLAIMSCVNECLAYQLKAPDWLFQAFNQRYRAVEDRKVKSWDDPKAFGKPFPKGANLSALRKKMNFRHLVWIDISRLRRDRPDIPIDENLFEEVGKKYGLGKTLTSEYYYEAKRMRSE